MMSAPETPPCPHGVALQTLSALRDGLLDAAETARVREHVATCQVCQARLADLDRIARALREQRELEPGQRVWQGIQAQVRYKEPNAMHNARRPIIGGIAAALTVVLLVVLFTLAINNRPGSHNPPPTATSEAQATPSVKATTATTTPSGPDYTVADPAIAAQLTFAYIKNNEVWVSLHGALPQQLTHLHLPDDAGCCQIIWSPDQSRILLTSYPSQQQSNHVWVITVPGGAVTEISTSKFQIPDGFNPCNCVWVNSRYLLYISDPASHTQGYSIFDTQTQTVIPSPLDKNRQAQPPVARNGQIYYTSPVESCNTTEIESYDMATGASAKAFTLPGSLVGQGIVGGSFILAADGQSVVMASMPENGGGCGPAPGYHPVQFQHLGSPPQQLFASLQSSNIGYQQITISPNGAYATALGNPYGEGAPMLYQQQVSSGAITTTHLVSANDYINILGWLPPAQGLIIAQAPLGNGTTSPAPVSLYFVRVGSNAMPTLVGTVNTSLDVLFPAPLEN